MSLADYSTNTKEEKEGVCVQFEGFRVTIARAGGSNKQYDKTLQRVSKPWKRLIDSGRLSNDKGVEILKEVYAQCIIKHWDTLQEDGSYKSGIQNLDDPKGELLPVNKETILATLNKVEDVFLDIMKEAESSNLYRSEVTEAEAKN